MYGGSGMEAKRSAVLLNTVIRDLDHILVQLDVTNVVTKQVTVNEKSQMLLVQDIEQPYISSPEAADPGSLITFNADSTNLPGWDISQVLLEFWR